ncbi:MAG: TauD/TfdA family dioxygenase [Streptosporangiaceae bacterium]
MDTFHAHHADIHAPGWQPRVTALLREHGLVTFTGITGPAALAGVARALMSIRPHRDAGPDGVTLITDTGTADPGYAAFTDAELIPHTDGTSLPDPPGPPGLLLLTCQQPASHGGTTLLADAARITATLAGQHPAALRALSAPRAAYFGAAGGYLGPVCEPAGPGRARIRLRLDDLAMFSADATPLIPVLRAAITQHQQTIQLRAGQGLLVSNTRWLHGRTRYTGPRVMLRILGDPLPGTGIQPGFPAPALGTHTAQAA